MTGKNINNRIVFLLILITFITLSCEKYSYPPPAVDPNAVYHFQADIQLIFNKDNCTDCHNGGRAPDLRDGRSFQALTTGGYVSKPGETSDLYKMLNTDNFHKSRTTEEDRLKIRYWIDQGAKNN